jgi:hypothetical protein
VAVIRPPLPVTAVPDRPLLDERLGHLAFRLLVLLHAETQQHLLDDDADLEAALGCGPLDLLGATRELQRAGYLVRTLAGDWQVTPWE